LENVSLMAKLEKLLFIVEQLSGGKRLSLKEINDRFPCFVQEWEGRWYLVAEHQNHKTPTVFALERMELIQQLSVKYL